MSQPVGRPTPVTNATRTQKPSGMPIHKYGRYEAVHIPDRTWPEQRITKAPAGSPRTCATATRH